MRRGIYLFCSNIESYHKVNGITLKELTKKYGLRGLYITLNRPYSAVKSHLINEGADVSKLYFVDGTDRKEGNGSKADNCAFVSSPGH